MFFKNRFDHLGEIFLSQFEQDGERILYRKHGRGAPIQVTHEEREEFRLQFLRATSRMIWGGVLAMMAVISLGVWLAPDFMDEGYGTIILAGVMIVAISVMSDRNTTAPARALERRTPIGNPLSKEESQAKTFSALSWPFLVAIFTISTAICVSILMRSEFSEWPEYLWTIGSGFVAILYARALWIKYRLSK